MAKQNPINPYTLENFPINAETEYDYILIYKDNPIIGILELEENTYKIYFISSTVSYIDTFVLIAKMEAIIELFHIDISEIPKSKKRMVKNVLRCLDYVSIGNQIYRYNFFK